MKVKKHANSRLRRSKSRKGNKGNKGNKGRGRMAKTRRMRGRGWFDWFPGSAAESAAGSAAGPKYMQVSTEESEPVMVTDVLFKDGKKTGKYTGRALHLDDGYSRQDPVGIMKYDDGSKYMGPFVNNKRHGEGVLTAKESCDVRGTRHDECETQLEGNWVDNVLTGNFTKTYYKGDTMLKLAKSFAGNRKMFLPQQIPAARPPQRR